MANTTYFSLKSKAFPNFATYYSWDGWTNGPLGSMSIVSYGITDINGDSKDDIVLDMFQDQAYQDHGIVTDAPTPNRVLFFVSQPDGTYRDLTSILLPDNTLGILDGMARNISVGDVNNDGKPDFAFPLSREDGRGTYPYSNSISQSVVMISLSDGTYEIIDIGNEDWSQTIQIVNSGSVGHVYFEGYTGANSLPGQLASVDIENTALVGYGSDYILNSTGDAFILNSSPPFSGSGLIVMPSSYGNGNTHIVSMVIKTSTNIPYPALSTLGDDGTWSITSYLQPHSFTTVPFIGWNEVFTLDAAAVTTINGEVVTGCGYDDFREFTPFPGSDPVAVLRFNGSAIKAPRSDGYYHQNDGMNFNHLEFYSVDGDELTVAPITIVGEETAINFNFDDFLDINNDGLDDIIVYRYYDTGAPIIYLNTGAGVFVHIDNSDFPSAPSNWANDARYGQATSTFMDANGDGINDLFYWRSMHYAGDAFDATPQLYLGNSSLSKLGNKYTDAITVSDRIGSPLINMTCHLKFKPVIAGGWLGCGHGWDVAT